MFKQKKSIAKATKNNFITYGILAVMFAGSLIWLESGAMPRQFTKLLVPLCTYSIAAVSLNLVVGVLGDLSLGHAGFMCIGAYSGAVFTNIFADVITNDLLRFFIALLVGGIFAAVFGFLICIPDGNPLFVVVGAAAGLASFDESFHELVVWHFEVEADVDCRLVCLEEVAECASLRDGARESVEDDSVDSSHAVEVGVDHVDDDFVGDEFAFVDVAFGEGSSTGPQGSSFRAGTLRSAFSRLAA